MRCSAVGTPDLRVHLNETIADLLALHVAQILTIVRWIWCDERWPTAIYLEIERFLQWAILGSNQ